jgi:signal transduction histidine kinase
MGSTLISDVPTKVIATSSPESRRTLLVVDDDPSVRHALWITFRDHYEVVLADSGASAFESFRARRADVAVLDIRMPGISGIELLRLLKEVDPGVEVILLSAYETVEYIRDAMRLGACDYLTKPYQVDRLRQAVRNAMGRRAATRKTAAYDARLEQLEKEMHHQQIREELARTRNEIYASIIHDINGPLTVIAGYVELMQQSIQHARVLESDQLGTLRNHAHNVALQVSNCIELSRRYLGSLEGKLSVGAHAAVKEILADVAELLKAHPQARRNELVITPCPDDITAAVHRTDLLQVLLNLTINALQCTQVPHRVELYAKVIARGAPRPFLHPADNTHFSASDDFPAEAPLVAIAVQDNGPGISTGTLPRIFEAYFTTKPPGQGTGLGLSIVRRLVFQAKGAVHVYSHLGEGTVFTIYLPLR